MKNYFYSDKFGVMSLEQTLDDLFEARLVPLN